MIPEELDLEIRQDGTRADSVEPVRLYLDFEPDSDDDDDGAADDYRPDDYSYEYRKKFSRYYERRVVKRGDPIPYNSLTWINLINYPVMHSLLSMAERRHFCRSAMKRDEFMWLIDVLCANYREQLRSTSDDCDGIRSSLIEHVDIHCYDASDAYFVMLSVPGCLTYFEMVISFIITIECWTERLIGIMMGLGACSCQHLLDRHLELVKAEC